MMLQMMLHFVTIIQSMYIKCTPIIRETTTDRQSVCNMGATYVHLYKDYL